MTSFISLHLNQSKNIIIFLYILLTSISCATSIKKDMADNHCQLDWGTEVFTCNKKSTDRIFYIGEMIFVNNISFKHGLGTEFYEDGSRYIGDFAYGQRDGMGEYILPGNATCNSKWKDDRQAGEVICVYHDRGNGHKRQGITDGSGNWVGETQYTFPSGISIIEYWENGLVVVN